MFRSGAVLQEDRTCCTELVCVCVCMCPIDMFLVKWRLPRSRRKRPRVYKMPKSIYSNQENLRECSRSERYDNIILSRYLHDTVKIWVKQSLSKQASVVLACSLRLHADYRIKVPQAHVPKRQ